MELNLNDERYPDKLLTFLKDPKRIYCRGDISLFDMPSIAVIGCRKCTAYGINIATKIGETAATYGVAVISGMARGIDTAAHKGAIKGGGKTIAVLGTGTDIIYPRENRELYAKISKEHLALSEYPDGTEVMPYHFPVRNRIISALADAVIVVESGVRGGALITAEAAAEQGKEVYAVPGNINSIYSIGTNKLIYDGVRPLINVEDVFREMGLLRKLEAVSDKMGSDEEKIYNEVAKWNEISISNLCEILSMQPGEINPIISILEIKGKVYCEMGKVMIANFA